MDALEFRFAFHASDFECSLHFYQNNLGMARVGGWDRPDGKGALLSAGGNSVIEIYGAAEGQTYDGPAPAAINLAICLADTAAVDRLYMLLKEAGCQVGDPPTDHHWGHRSFTVRDPDGIPIHYYCVISR